MRPTRPRGGLQLSSPWRDGHLMLLRLGPTACLLSSPRNRLQILCGDRCAQVPPQNQLLALTPHMFGRAPRRGLAPWGLRKRSQEGDQEAAFHLRGRASCGSPARYALGADFRVAQALSVTASGTSAAMAVRTCRPFQCRAVRWLTLVWLRARTAALDAHAIPAATAFPSRTFPSARTCGSCGARSGGSSCVRYSMPGSWPSARSGPTLCTGPGRMPATAASARR
mmetsp:Transcript_116499/g.249136  ORF Transcript_116499/g.249136 Transcript_116499/m.249136 type:complete len:225 (-) Transcript_116499:407-1081(-)